MFKQAVDKLKDHMMLYNPFFKIGFSSAWQDESAGDIWAETDNGRRPVFPEDRLGDYFYIRPNGNSRLQRDDQRFPVIECVLSGMMAYAPMRLVAVVNSADPDKLVLRLVNVLANCGLQHEITSVNWNRELITVSEMRYAEEKEQAAALQNLKSQAIVSIDFTLVTEQRFKRLNCLPEICKSC